MKAPNNHNVSEKAFLTLICGRSRELFSLARMTVSGERRRTGFTRPFLGDLLSEATKVEEILDNYGARNSQRWYSLRHSVAPMKLFSGVAYMLLHIQHFLPLYHLLPVDEDFLSATKRVFRFTCKTLSRIAESLLEQAEKMGLDTSKPPSPSLSFTEDLPPGHLPFDRTGRKVASPEETVVYLATAFLNLAEDSKFIKIEKNEENHRGADYIPDPISEERMRNLEQKFHNLQSLYDTYISDSNVESLDEDLPVLRGHITVIYHLLETATAFTHYCERHMLMSSTEPFRKTSALIDPDELLDALMGYSLAFSSRFISATRSLCHAMLRRYAIQGRVSVPVPRYRGFHVRPSTLIAKIVYHYGSEIRMELQGNTYDAGATLDIFRANEALNALKRRNLAEEVTKLSSEETEKPDCRYQPFLQMVVQTLFKESRLILYDRNLSLDDFPAKPGETGSEYAVRVLMHLFAMGKIDMEMDIQVSFSGDRRVLEDIRLLAENGYGEDDFGNNLPLPEPLTYLRK